MHHAEWLIRRIIFLEGSPDVSRLNPMKIGKTVPDMVYNDQEAEQAAIGSYNDAIVLSHQVADQATADLLGRILLMEEGHADWAEMQRSQIELGRIISLSLIGIGALYIVDGGIAMGSLRGYSPFGG